MTTPMQALEAVSFKPYYTASDIWSDDVISIDAIHKDAFAEVRRVFGLMKRGKPYTNFVFQGRPGVGKSHLLGRVRRGVTKGENVFVLVSLSSARHFWHSVSIAYADALFREGASGRTQLEFVLDALSERVGLSKRQKAKLLEGNIDSALLKAFRNGLAMALGKSPKERPTIVIGLALALLNSNKPAHQDVGNAIVQDVETPDEEDIEGLSITRIPSIEVVSGFDRIFGLAGKFTIIAIDQLDGLIALSRSTSDLDQKGVINEVAAGLMELAEVNHKHTLVILSCLVDTWLMIRDQGVASAWQRYTNQQILGYVPSPEAGAALIARYIEPIYAEAGFKPPYPTWPVLPQAFDDAQDFSPRRLILETEEHIKHCRSSGSVVELSRFGAAQTEKAEAKAEAKADPSLDARFSELRKAADISGVLDKEHVEKRLPSLLRAGLEAWIQEQEHPQSFSLDAPPGRNPALHARLRQIVDADLEDEVHWSFRAVPHDHPTAALTRLRSAVTASGIGERRSLFVIRNSSWSTGAKTREVVGEFDSKGGKTVRLSDDDLRTFAALAKLLAEKPGGLAGWLLAAKPASATDLLSGIRPTPDAPMPLENIPSAPSKGATPSGPTPPPDERGYDTEPGEIPIGRSDETGKTLTVPLEDLRRHVAIFAGSGSGKTVLIRRLVEECALKGVSSIVLDPNNDLARLGTPWPETPGGWFDGDAARAAEYHDNVDVAVWTPRLSAGRPIAFAPLADLGAVSGEPDEFELALDNTVAMLLPRAGLPKTGSKVAQGQAILKEALKDFTANGGAGLKEFLGYLASLPEGASRIAGAPKLAGDMANTLIAATINDPLFGGAGTTVDPATLLTPPEGKRARISVISLAGLQTNEQRQGFVSQLQMALFAWVKKNPAGDRPLGGLFVMDEAQTFAPAKGSTPCLQSTLALASQARKYGLGLIFATQAPKGLHNQIPGNATTQFFGFLNAPVQIAAAKEMAIAKGGDITGIAQLGKGQFFAASDGLAFQKIRSPLCLSHHPSSPLTQEDIVTLALSASS